MPVCFPFQSLSFTGSLFSIVSVHVHSFLAVSHPFSNLFRSSFYTLCNASPFLSVPFLSSPSPSCLLPLLCCRERNRSSVCPWPGLASFLFSVALCLFLWSFELECNMKCDEHCDVRGHTNVLLVPIKNKTQTTETDGRVDVY